MDELSEEDKLTVVRARKIQKFLSQPFQVAEVFTGQEGKYVPLKETITGFERVLNGEHFVMEISAYVLIVVDSLKKTDLLYYRFFLSLSFDLINFEDYSNLFWNLRESIYFVKYKLLIQNVCKEINFTERCNGLSCFCQQVNMITSLKLLSTWWVTLRRWIRRQPGWQRSNLRPPCYYQFIIIGWSDF